MDTVIFAPDLIEYAFVGVSLSDAKFLRGDINMNHDLLIFAQIKLKVFVPLFNAAKSMSYSGR